MIVILNDITKIVRVLLATFQAVASQDELTQRRIGQIGEVIGAVDDVAKTETSPDASIAARRIEEAHDIIHRVARILVMEDEPLSEEPWDGKACGETIEVEEAEV